MITPTAILSTAYVPSMHRCGGMVQFKAATCHMWTCHSMQQEFKMLTAHSAVLRMPGRVGGGLTLRREDENVPA